MRLIVDMDNVLADTLTFTIEKYQNEFKTSINKNHLAGKYIEDVIPENHVEIVKSYPFKEGFFKSLPVMENSQESLYHLHTIYDLYIVSSAMNYPYSFNEKYNWLKKYFYFIKNDKIVFCGDKKLIAGDIMIDDNDFNLKYFCGRKLLFTTISNINEKNYERVNNWNDVLNKL